MFHYLMDPVVYEPIHEIVSVPYENSEKRIQMLDGCTMLDSHNHRFDITTLAGCKDNNGNIRNPITRLTISNLLQYRVEQGMIDQLWKNVDTLYEDYKRSGI